MTNRTSLPAWPITAVLLIAWLGVWGAWLTHPTAALTYNAPDMAEWAGFLPEVRFGPLGHAPDSLRLGVGLGAVALAIGAAWLPSAWMRWACRALVVLTGLVILPPYPQVLDLWRSEAYGVRFLIAALTMLACPLAFLLDRHARTCQALVALVGADALWAAGNSYFSLRGPFAALYTAPLSVGWGFILFVVGLTSALVLSLLHLVLLRARARQAAPAPAENHKGQP
jgi:hypothetical protein